MAAFIAAAAAQAGMKAPSPGEALSGVFGSISLTAWICLLVRRLPVLSELLADC